MGKGWRQTSKPYREVPRRRHLLQMDLIGRYQKKYIYYHTRFSENHATEASRYGLCSFSWFLWNANRPDNVPLFFIVYSDEFFTYDVYDAQLNQVGETTGLLKWTTSVPWGEVLHMAIFTYCSKITIFMPVEPWYKLFLWSYTTC